jgi:phospholipase/carboxylesterase
VAAVVNLSGFLVSPESLPLRTEDMGQTPLFWGHGTDDPAVPFSLAIRGRERFREKEIPVESRDYAIGHWVAPQEMVDLRAWLGEKVPGWDG